MLGAKLLLVMVLGQAPAEQADPGELVSRLGAGRYADREAASQALERLGRPALPALRTARDSHDPEIRNRAASLLQRIEGSLLTQPTRVRLDFERAPLTDVVRSLEPAGGLQGRALSRQPPEMEVRKGHSAGARTGHLLEGHRPPVRRRPAPASSRAARHRRPPRADLRPDRRPVALGHAQFRSRPIPDQPDGDPLPARPELRGLGGRRRRGLRSAGGNLRPVRTPPHQGRLNPVTSVQFTASLLVTAEPRLCISQSGASR